MDKEVAFARSLVGSFPTGNDLQGNINKKGIGESLDSENSRFFSVRVAAVQAPYQKDAAQGGASSCDQPVRNIGARAYRTIGQRVQDLLIEANQGRGPGKKKGIPFHISSMERGRPNLFLIL